ncbi:hypothetical protein ACTNC1_03815 [Atopobiaceae bacterium HCP3S3_A4]
MKIQECIEINGMTLMVIDQDLPGGDWRKLVIDGLSYDPVLPMDMGNKYIGVNGIHDFTGKEITFV